MTDEQNDARDMTDVEETLFSNVIALRSENERLRKERDYDRRQSRHLQDVIDRLNRKLSQPAPAPQPADDLRAALEPFARLIEVSGWSALPDDTPILGQGPETDRRQVTAGDFKRALAALSQNGGAVKINWRDGPAAIVEDDEPQIGSATMTSNPTRGEVERKLLDWESCEWNHVIALRREAADAIAALREQLEAAERKLAWKEESRVFWVDTAERAETALTEARAREAAAWEAGATAMGSALWGHADDERFRAHNLAILRAKDRLTPPTDALTARLDAELARALEPLQALKDAAKAAGLQDRLDGIRDAEDAIRALRRAPKEGKSHE